MMTPDQAELLLHAPRYRMAYGATKKAQLLIPDTEKALQWAAKSGAERVDSLTFHRLEPDGKPSRYRAGDFHCRISRVFSSAEAGMSMLTNAISHLLVFRLKMSALTDINIIYICRSEIEFTVPMASFHGASNSINLNHYYLALSKILNAFLSESDWRGLRIIYDGKANIPNHPLGNDEFAVPFRLAELATMSEDYLSQAVCRPRPSPGQGFSDEISHDLHQMIMQEARRIGKSDRPEPAWEALRPFDRSSGYTSGAVCAEHLLGWIQGRGITEFSRRNAIRIMDGKFTLHGGVEAALQLLLAGGYIRKCPPLRSHYPGHPPASWYLVNPLIHVAPTDRNRQKPM